ncbi:MAG: hypothetical protein QOD72_4015 [Acidimicrobiaceae bacterium]|nr:hypothetical protein [Acidimicrobiaceae bacterium]
MSDVPRPPPPPPPPGYIPYTYGQAYAVAPRRNGLGIAAMVLGIVAVVVPCFWLFQIPGVLAIIFGLVSLSQVKKNPQNFTGRGMAIAGLVLGLVSMVILALWLVFGNFHFNVNNY